MAAKYSLDTELESASETPELVKNASLSTRKRKYNNTPWALGDSMAFLEANNKNRTDSCSSDDLIGMTNLTMKKKILNVRINEEIRKTIIEEAKKRASMQQKLRNYSTYLYLDEITNILTQDEQNDLNLRFIQLAYEAVKASSQK